MCSLKIKVWPSGGDGAPHDPSGPLSVKTESGKEKAKF
jgi:hypothetical protein